MRIIHDPQELTPAGRAAWGALLLWVTGLAVLIAAPVGVMTAVYLATVGRNRVGFSREDTGPATSPRYVKGFKGLVERSAMRYYLAFEAFLDFESLPVDQRFEASINAVYDLIDHYPTQLHDMEKAEYLDAKRRERENTLRLQQALDAAALRSNER